MRARWKWTSGFLVAAIVVLIGWQWTRPRSVPPLPPAKIIAVAPVADWLSARATAPHTADDPKIGPNPSAIEVCGVGRVKVDPGDETGGYGYVATLTKKTRLRWLAALRNSDDYRARATGLYLQNIYDGGAPEYSEARNELVQLAVGTQDPAVYALAYSKCSKQSDDTPPGPCQQLSPEEWTRRDPDNALPWLLIAAKARQENDRAAEQAAFAQVAKARGYDSYGFSLMKFAESEAPSDATPLERWSFAVELGGVEAAMPMPIGPYFKYCSAEGVSDPTVRQQCAALAELLVAKGTTLIDLSFAATLGARLGWPADRVSGLRQRSDATMGMLEEAIPPGREEQWSCTTAARGNAYMAERMRLGELGAVQELIDRSGESIPELARKHSEFIEELTRSR
jgi:hypothetical protein